MATITFDTHQFIKNQWGQTRLIKEMCDGGLKKKPMGFCNHTFQQ